MRTVWLIPVAYVAGIEGFGWFVPYLLFVCAIATLRRIVSRRTRSSAGIHSLDRFDCLELEPAAA
jgi:hypothetical protein